MTPVYQRLRGPGRKKQVCKAAKQSLKTIRSRAEFQAVVPFKRFRINDHNKYVCYIFETQVPKTQLKLEKCIFYFFPKLSKLLK